MKTHPQLIKDLDDMIAIQSSNGNWNYDEHMLGLANGMILARHILRDERGEAPLSDCSEDVAQGIADIRAVRSTLSRLKRRK